MSRQQKLKEFFLSDQSSSSQERFEDELNEPNEEQQEKKKRGAPRLPLRWTRVFRVTRDQAQEIKVYNLETDETQFFQHYNEQNHRVDNQWKPLFDPLEFHEQKDTLKCRDFQLGEQSLVEYAKQVSSIRQEILELADRTRQIEDEDSLRDQDIRIPEPTAYRRGFTGTKQKNDQINGEACQSYKYSAEKPKKRHLKSLTHQNLTDIAHDSLVKLKSNDEISANYNVKAASISQLICKMKRDDKYLIKKFEKQQHQEKIEDLIVKITTEILSSGQSILRASFIQFQLNEQYKEEASLYKIKRVFKDKLFLRFGRVKKIPFLGNAERCLVMRHLYAKEMIQILLQNKTVWNFDESFMKDSNFVRKRWWYKDQQNSVPVNSVSPRISILLAMNNHGDAYLSLSQSKTDSEKVILFFEYFFQQLDLAQPDWRETSVLLMDGASYHTSEETMLFLKRNRVQVFISAPYSYDAAPCEMWFSYFKSQELNPDHLPLGKRQSENLFLTLLDHFKIQQESQETG